MCCPWRMPEEKISVALRSLVCWAISAHAPSTSPSLSMRSSTSLATNSPARTCRSSVLIFCRPALVLSGDRNPCTISSRTPTS